MDIPSPTDNLKETAEFYRLALGLGLVTVDEVVAWCDTVIAAQGDPPLAILRASMVKGKKHNEVENELALLEGEFDEAAVYRRLFGKMYEVLRQDRAQLPRILDGMATLHSELQPSTPEMQRELAHFIERQYWYVEEPETREMELYRDKFTTEVLDFLQQAARGKATEYHKMPPPSPASPRLRLDVTLFAWMAGCAVLKAQDPDRVGRSSLDWTDIQLLLIVLTVYFVVNRFPRKH